MPELPPIPRPAASLILLRQGEELEVLVGRRTVDAPAFPGATVFPGGKIEPQDAPPGAGVIEAASRAAIREAFEETGLLITDDGLCPLPRGDLQAGRAAVEAGRAVFMDLLAEWNLRAGLSRLTPFAHWITPEHAPYRFDTYFFVAQASRLEGGAPLICAEFEEVRWVAPRSLLRDEAARLIRPTRRSLEMLCESATAEAAVEAAQARGLVEGEAVRA
jgi:8-oxo-dGTP pyrophosphatase MutT (NUDIX family)